MAEKRFSAERLSLLGRATLSLQAATGDQPARRRFTIVASTGEPLRGQGAYGWGHPVIVDLAGIEAAAELPILDAHGPPPGSSAPLRWALVGQSDSARVVKGEFIVTGSFMEQEQAAKDILRIADQGFNWQASIGATCLQKDFIAEGNTVAVNGRSYEGPCFVSRKTLIREVSFVVIGDDPGTSVMVASEGIMAKKTFAAYCKAHGYPDPESMTADRKAKLKALFEEDDEDQDEDEDDDSGDGKKKAEARALLYHSLPGVPITGQLLAEGRALYLVTEEERDDALFAIKSAGGGYVVARQPERGLVQIYCDVALSGTADEGQALNHEEASTLDRLMCQAGGKIGGAWTEGVSA
jgi:hypothetical protein